MALTQRLEFRQSQSLVMTPQLMQAIKLLQLSNLDLSAFVEEELERNPLLERASDGPEAPVAGEATAERAEPLLAQPGARGTRGPHRAVMLEPDESRGQATAGQRLDHPACRGGVKASPAFLRRASQIGRASCRERV